MGTVLQFLALSLFRSHSNEQDRCLVPIRHRRRARGSIVLVWLSLGVGIIGKDGDPANLMYFGVLAVGISGAFVARFQPHGMARALLATALAQALVTAIALVAGLGLPWSGPAEILALNGFFIAMFVGSAWLFRCSAHGRPEQGGA